MREIPVVAAVVQENDRYLVCLRPRHKRHGGYWEFPGGKLDPGENLAEAAARELDEELNVQVLSSGPVLFESHDTGSPFRILFVEVTIDGHPEPTEHDAIRWATLEELATMPLAPTDSRFVDYLLIGR